ncbi:hypothetical protein [Tardiphaga sp.]|uniref:hypothetical protein n=1 Tax=Tardiphaga sp. TaxID=1926292 RepID=UPI00260CB9A1|nr:hypothetical protein [Tardiphaga sp.]MDB5620506.1 hypothetical protein [Tardiphaga sp.]
MTSLSISTRKSFNAESSDDVPVVLIELWTLDGPHYLSSDPTERLSTDPLKYGTRHSGNDYGFAMMSAAWPDDQDRKPPSTSLVFANVAEDMAKAARSGTDQFEVVMKLVMSSNPEFIEDICTLTCTGSTYNATQLTLTVSREPIEAEPYPAHRMTRERFPGLFR